MKEILFSTEWWNRMAREPEFLLFDPTEVEVIKPSQMIFDFRDDNRFLSNFHLHGILVKGKWFPSSEHAYQAFKTFDPDWFRRIQFADSCRDSKDLGGQAPLRPDWEEVKYDVMLEALSSKFSVPELAAKLLATGDAYLVEGNYWHDTTWGVCTIPGCRRCSGKISLNLLGKALMTIRAALRDRKNWGYNGEAS